MKLNMKYGMKQLVLVAALFLTLLTGCSGEKETHEQLELKLGLPIQPASAPLIIALEKGYFKEEGLKVIVTEYPSGKRALAGVCKGEVEVCTVADAAFVAFSFKYPSLRIFSQLAVDDHVNAIVARKDHGITAPYDLKGKKIGTQYGSAVHYFLDNFLVLNEISQSDVDMKYMKAEKLVPALVRGDIDAFSMREPYLSLAEASLKGKVEIFRYPGAYVRVEVLVAPADVLDKKLDAYVRFIKGVFRGCQLIIKNNREASDIIAARFDIPTSESDRIVKNTYFNLCLNYALLSILETEAKWCVDHKIIEGKSEIPDYIKMINPKVLMKVRPKSVSIEK